MGAIGPASVYYTLSLLGNIIISWPLT